jgi:hypothetical protein
MTGADNKESILPQAGSFGTGDFLRIVKNLATSPDNQVMSRAVLKTELDTLYQALVAPGANGNVLTSNGSVWTSAAPTGGGAGINYLINGGYDFAQRQTPGTLTTVADKGWGADRWQQFAENASWQYNRNDATGETGLTSKNYGLFKKITNTGKGIFTQKVEGINSVPLRGKTVIFQIKMKSSANKTIRIGILELQNAGTIDTFPAAIASAFGANTVDPTWGANVAVITAAVSCSVLSASWTSFSVSVTVPSNSKNLVCAVWTDSQFAANDTLSVAEAGLFVAATIQPWMPISTEIDLAQCQRFCWVISPGAMIGYGASATQFNAAEIYFPVTMFKAPTYRTDATTWITGYPDTAVKYAIQAPSGYLAVTTPVIPLAITTPQVALVYMTAASWTPAMSAMLFARFVWGVGLQHYFEAEI